MTRIESRKSADIIGQHERFVVPSYGRFALAISRGEGRHVWDVDGRRYLDFGAGIAVSCLGHGHPSLVRAIQDQAPRMLHVSNLYYHELQGELARRLSTEVGPGKMFFCNSGAEANEGLIKLARRFGHDEGRYEIITANGSFHGRTLAGIAATGQEKVKKGFGPAVPGFVHVPFNDIDAVSAAISPSTVAVLVEGIQGEGGIHAATPEFLTALRRLCDEHRLLLLMDGVQCGHFRTGRFQSFQRILEGTPPATPPFLPDAVAMAKSLGGGFPMGAFWVGESHSTRLGPGSHGTTYGGSPIACAAASGVLDAIEQENLAANARAVGGEFLSALDGLVKKYPHLLDSVRGLGLMIGVELKEAIPGMDPSTRPLSLQLVDRLQEAGLLTIPSGGRVVRFLPALNVTSDEIGQALDMIEDVLKRILP